MREVRIGFEVFESCVANDAARAEGFNSFERVVLIAVFGKVLAAMVLVVALGDGDAPLAVDLLDGASGVQGSRGGANQVGVEAGA